MYIRRELESKLAQISSVPEIIAILGARQVGKTTLLRNFFLTENSKMISFEDRQILSLFQEDEKAFANYYLNDCDTLIIDEFQYAREGGRKLKFIYDSFPGKKIVISGSSSLELTEQATKYLVGRIFLFHLETFNFSEFLSAKDKNLHKMLLSQADKILEELRKIDPVLPTISQTIIQKSVEFIDELVLFGGYPRAVLSDNNIEKTTVLQNIFNTYLLKEIREILNLPDDYQMEKLTKFLGLRIADIMNINDISNALGISYKRLQQLLHVLEKTYIIQMIPPFYTNNLLELTKSRKLFFKDTGFRNAVINNFTNLAERTDSSDLYENLVFSELMKKDIKAKFWRTKSKAEVDIIMEIEGRIIPVEIKSNLKRNNVQRSMISFIKKYQPEIGFIVSRNYFDIVKIENTNVFFIPFALFILIDLKSLRNVPRR
ncbi:MAG: ATP-binding protein [Candidatus Cloacimonadales bacterium]|nr:ATP-binding protein [Candidatus Cloacimonadales bacterium]